MSDIVTTSVSEWKQSSGTLPEPVDLPSGKKAMLRRPGIETFVLEGIIPNSLLDVIQAQLENAKGKKSPEQVQADLAEAAAKLFEDNSDMSKLADMMKLADAVTVRCMVQPRCYPEPSEGNEPEVDKLYPSDVQLEDKFFIFSYAVGGTKDLERFREQLASNVVTVHAVEIAEVPAE